MFAGVSLAAGFVYLATICPDVEYIDSGELAVNCLYLGIPHPTGYPLYMLLGRLAVIFFPGEIIFRCNLLSLLATALSVGLLAMLINLFCQKKPYHRLAGIAVALFMAFTAVWWDQGTSNEVYALTLFLDLLVMIMMLKYANGRQTRHLMAGLYIWGLSFGVHLSTILLMPALLYLFLITGDIKPLISRRYIWTVLFFVAGLSVYFYLPIRASHEPFLNWSDPAHLEGFIHHISGWQYRVWMFGSINTMLGGAGHFLRLFYAQYGAVGLGLILIGLYYSFRSNPKLSIFAAAIILGDIAYSINYEIVDIDSYYLIAFACLGMFAAAGLIQLFVLLWRMLPGKQLLSHSMPFLMACALPIWALIANYSGQDKSNRVLAAKGVEIMLASIDENGLAIVENWDIYSPWLYYRYALGVRPDVILIDKELLRRSWYVDFLSRSYPEIIGSSQAEIDRFLRLLKPFELGRSYDSQALTIAYRAMIKSLIKNNQNRRPIYTNILGDPDVVPDLFRNPAGVIYRLDDRPLCREFGLDKLDFDLWDSERIFKNPRARIILTGFVRAISIKASLCHQLGNQLEAESNARLAHQLGQMLEHDHN